MEEKAGAQISRRAFVQSIVILFILMIAAGILGRVVPAGSYTRSMLDGREVIQAGSYQVVEHPDYPVWRWLTAPLEVLGGPDGVTIIVIIIFLLMVGVSFAVLDKSGILQYALARLVQKFGGRKYVLLLLVTFFFMLVGAFFGIFEEYRQDAAPRPEVADKYNVWPLLDFESAVEDHLLGTTLIIRGKDLTDSETRQRYVYKYMGWKYPETMHWGRVQIHEFGKLTPRLEKGDS